MKTRTSLVSNSSSSSFILVGIPIDIDQLNATHIIPHFTDKNKVTLSTVVMGKYLGEGQDVFCLTDPGQLAFINDNPDFFGNVFIKCLYVYDPCESNMHTLKELIDAVGPDAVKMVVTGGTADQSSSWSLDAMLENYTDELTEKTKKDVAETYRKKYNPK